MTKPNEISRRDFLITLLAASGISFFAGSYWYTSKVEKALGRLGSPIHEKNIRALFTKIEDSMNIIGKEYINNFSFDESKSDIISRINNNFSVQNLSTEMFFDLKKRIKQQVISDFKNDNIVNIGNWMITITEAQICAVIYLSK